MEFIGGRSTKPFWDHVAHLAVRHVDEDGVPCRVLEVGTCMACKALWATLTPRSGRGFPAPVADGMAGVYVRSDVMRVREDAAKAATSADAPIDREPLSVMRVRRFTEFKARRPLERY